ncbi:hypothetical protein L6452_01703 [Arctium lappa]|uniref:Uncharacterized protein n=1 Tax=Arctium lappa TaxID=4217 RepID=A0ACB9FHE8_ARCLA|nr:hypothetical protein L6452_01703 [Arctium lappa]
MSFQKRITKTGARKSVAMPKESDQVLFLLRPVRSNAPKESKSEEINDGVVEMETVGKNIQGEVVTRKNGMGIKKTGDATKETGEANGQKEEKKGKKTPRVKTWVMRKLAERKSKRIAKSKGAFGSHNGI